MEKIHSRLLLGLALWCLMSAGSLTLANDTMAIQIHITMPSSHQGLVPRNMVLGATEHGTNRPRIDSLDLQRLSETLQYDATKAPEIAGGSAIQDRFVTKHETPVLSPHTGSQSLQVLVLVNEPGGRNLPFNTTAAGTEKPYTLNIKVTIGTQKQQLDHNAKYLPRAMYIAAKPIEQREPGPAEPSACFDLERWSETGAMGAHDLSTAACLKALPSLGIAQPLPEF